MNYLMFVLVMATVLILLGVVMALLMAVWEGRKRKT
jgi:hypothetical protein